MHKRMWIIGLAAVLLAPDLRTQRADAGGIGFATEYTQILNYVQLVMHYERQAQQLETALQTARMIEIEGQQLVTHPGSSVNQDLMALTGVIQGVNGLAYTMAQLDTQFRSDYQGYGVATSPYYPRYASWSNQMMTGIRTAMSAAGLQNNQILTEQNAMNQIKTLMSTTQGRDEAIELGNVLTTEVAGSIQRLHQTMLSDVESKQAWMAYQVSKDQATENAHANAFNYVDRNADHAQFGSVPGMPQ